MSRSLRVAALSSAALALTAAPAAARDYAGTALNIIPSGQWGAVPPPDGADLQAKMYDALTPLGGDVAEADLRRTFKSSRLGAVDDGPFTAEKVPRKGVRILRDRFHVPHITGRSRDDVTWATGWVLAKDRELLLQVGRYPARLAAIDAPNINAFSLVTGLKSYTPTRAVERMIRRNGDRALARAGRDGRAIRHDIEVYVAGVNAALRDSGSTQKPFSRVDVYAVNALAGQIFGEGGGDEPRRAEFLSELRRRVGFGRGTTIFKDLSEHSDPDHDATLSRVFPYGRAPGTRRGNAVIDAGSYKRWTVSPRIARGAQSTHRWASNFLMVAGRRSANGHPLFVAGPQVGYFYPGLTLEIDVKGPGFQARGATAPGFPGNVLIGRGQDYAWSLTSAGSDLVDTFVETLCGGSTTRYLYKGRCRRMGTVDAGAIAGEGRVRYRTTVHGPVLGYATVKGRRVALSRKRASFGRDVLWQLPFRDLTLNRVGSAKTFFDAMARSPFTFNAAYADDRDIAMYSAGRLPIRDRRVDPRLPTNGTGEYEWKGFLAKSRHPRQVDHPSGAMLNWNNAPAPAFAASDENWAYGSLHRNSLLEHNVAERRVHDLASLTGAMNDAATQDLRSTGLTPVLADLLRGGLAAPVDEVLALVPGAPAPSARARRMLDLLVAWHRSGSSRLDRDGDGLIDAGPAPAIWDALYERLFAAVMGDVLGPQLDDLRRIVGSANSPASGFSGGGIAYLDKALRTLTGTRFEQPFRTRFCAGGVVTACRQAVWKAIEDTGAALAAQQGTPDPGAWRARRDTTRFDPVDVEMIHWTNRPSGIQQLMTFTGHRPRG